MLNAEEYINYMSEAGAFTKDYMLKNWDGVTDTDWAKEAFENGEMMKHNLAFQGGNKDGNYYLSLSYLNNDDFLAQAQANGRTLLRDKNGDYYGVSRFSNGEQYNPLIMSQNNANKASGYNVNGSIYADFTPLKGLTLTSRFGYRLAGIWLPSRWHAQSHGLTAFLRQCHAKPRFCGHGKHVLDQYLLPMGELRQLYEDVRRTHPYGDAGYELSGVFI